MKTGEELKKKLGLEKLKYVSFIRLLEGSHRLIVVFYDSRRDSIPLTTQRVLRSSNLFSSQLFPFEKQVVHTPLLPIEKYNGSLRNMMFISIDLSGLYGDPDLQIQKESILFGKSSLKEYVTLKDLQNSDAVSSFTKNTRSERQRAMKDDGRGTGENFYTKLIECNLDTVKDHVTFVFLTEATEPIYPDDADFSEVNPENNFRLSNNSSKTYELYIRILDFMDWLKNTRPDSMEGKDITRKEIKDVLESANIQVFNNSPSFHWQGVNFWISQLDGSIYPTNIKPTFWNRSDLHGNDGAFLDKHLAGLFRSIDFFLNPMSSMLTKKLKDRKLL